jgi:hypothetical protein
VLILLKMTCFGIWLLIMIIIIKAVYKKHKFPTQDFIWKLQDDKHKCHGDGSSREII